MSPHSRRAAAAALIGVLAGGVPVSAATAASSPGAGGAAPGGATAGTEVVPTPQPSLTPPAGTGAPAALPQIVPAPGTAAPASTGAPSASGGAQCGQVFLTNTLPTVITCGPVTIAFNTVTTTTTITTLRAPATTPAGFGCNTPRRANARRRSRSAGRRSRTFVVRPAAGAQTARLRLLFRPGWSF